MICSHNRDVVFDVLFAMEMFCLDCVRNFGTCSTFAVLFDVVFADVVVFDVLFGRER